MIQANELRVGNWVGYFNYSDPMNNKLATVTEIMCRNEIGNYSLMLNDMEEKEDFNIEPIPLTPDILVKCGFEKSTDSYGGYLSPAMSEGGRIRLREFSLGGYHWDNGCGTTKIKYVHQLQNLYYSLTGQELTINLNT